MINIENDLFDELTERLTGEYSNINVVGEELNAPAEFPTVSFVETDNAIPTRYIDSTDEPFNEVAYTINIYTNSQGTKKSEAKKILTLIDSFMLSKGFIRNMKQPVSMNNSTIYRLVSRYGGVVSNDKKIYGR